MPGFAGASDRWEQSMNKVIQTEHSREWQDKGYESQKRKMGSLWGNHRFLKLGGLHRIPGIIAFWLIAAILFVGAGRILCYNENESMVNVKGFYQEKRDSLDVVMIGPSELYADYSPPLAWKEFGYTSYNLAISGVPGNLYISMLREVLSRQNPKLIVFNVSGFYWGDSAFSDWKSMHKWFDNTPFSLKKTDEIKRVVPKDKQEEFWWDTLTYHNNWKHPVMLAKKAAINMAMTWTGTSYAKGLRTYSTSNQGVGTGQTMCMSFSQTARQYLEELLQYCRDQNLSNVLFVAAPHQSQSSDPEVLEEIGSVVEHAGYDYLNLDKQYTAMGIDAATDFIDAEHLNMYGMRRMTSYLGSYITEHYELDAEHDSKTADHWNRCYDKTEELLQQCENDMNNGITREYYEASFYHRTKPVN